MVARSIIAGAWIGVSVMLCLGCGSKEVARGDHATAHLKVLGILYGQCMADNGGKAPANADQLVAYLQREPANWDKLAASPQEFLSLGSDGSRLVVLYGNDVKAIGDGVPWVAYESTEVDGARMVVNAQGGVQLMDKAEFGQHFPNPYGGAPMPRTRKQCNRAFTLVELLVVIAIIGVLIALLLPAIQAAREAARRAECSNKLKQVGLSVQNFVGAKTVFPTGGAHWRPQVENYVEGGKPLGPEKQGLGWGYQILPYLEQGALYNITTTAALQATVVPGYVCPSRRNATSTPDPLSPLLTVVLSDYVAAMPCGYSDYTMRTQYYPLGVGRTPGDSPAMRRERLFGGTASNPYVITVPDDRIYLGAITRTPTKSVCSRGSCVRTRAANVSSLVEMQHIEDGTSNTMMIGEKFVRPDLYTGGSGSDDRGWSDGWDPDSMRSTCFPPMEDGSGLAVNDALFGQNADVLNFGSAHSGGFNCVFVDGSVHTISYEIDPLVFDRLGDRRDGEVVDTSAL